MQKWQRNAEVYGEEENGSQYQKRQRGREEQGWTLCHRQRLFTRAFSVLWAVLQAVSLCNNKYCCYCVHETNLCVDVEHANATAIHVVEKLQTHSTAVSVYWRDEASFSPKGLTRRFDVHVVTYKYKKKSVPKTAFAIK